MSKIKHILSVIHYTICGAVCFPFIHFSCADWENIYIYTLFYHHNQAGSMNYYPLFRVRSWNNGVHCQSFYILLIRMRFGVTWTNPMVLDSTHPSVPNVFDYGNRITYGDFKGVQNESLRLPWDFEPATSGMRYAILIGFVQSCDSRAGLIWNYIGENLSTF